MTKTYFNWCGKLDKLVELDWYAKYCECGEEIVGVPDRPKEGKE